VKSEIRAYFELWALPIVCRYENDRLGYSLVVPTFGRSPSFDLWIMAGESYRRSYFALHFLIRKSCERKPYSVFNAISSTRFVEGIFCHCHIHIYYQSCPEHAHHT